MQRIFQLSMESLLNNPKVCMRNAQAVERKLNLLMGSGKDKLLVISDFDYTLSRFHDDSGKNCWTTHGVFDVAASTVSPSLGAKFEELKNKYFPIEFDPHMSIAEKTPHMIQWWETSHKHIVQAGFTRDAINNFVCDANLQLRDEAREMILDLQEHNVPLIIFSAGVGNIISTFLKNVFNVLPTNVHILSNIMIFNEDGVVTGFSEPLIHTFNKNSSVIERKGALFDEIQAKNSVILLGDGLGDLQMDVGVVNEQVALKIGFLNLKNNALLERFMEGYDIVLLDDQSMKVPRMILDLVLKPEGKAKADEQNLSTHSSCHLEVIETAKEIESNENEKAINLASKVPA